MAAVENSFLLKSKSQPIPEMADFVVQSTYSKT
jgi:hypothetical protein